MRPVGFGPSLPERLLALFFPGHCFLCGALTADGAAVCESCGQTLPREALFRPGPPPVFSAFPYEGPCREALHRFKFQNERWLARPLGDCMARALPEEARWDAVCFAPLSPEGKKRRGYDQSALLARETARRLGLPCLPLLEKTRETRVQHELPRQERLENVKNAYRADPAAAGKRLLLTDDIVTTGATLRECARALFAAGAAEVTAVAAADATRPREEAES